MDRIDTWLKNNVQQVADGLRSGASPDQIAEAERRLGVELPADVRASYGIHDGQEGGALMDMYELLSLDETMIHWQQWKDILDTGIFIHPSDPDPKIKSDWWNPRWIPLTHNGGGDHLCLDLDPNPTGVVGQIITMWHDTPEREVIASSFAELLAQFAEDLENDLYIFAEEYDYLAPIDQL